MSGRVRSLHRYPIKGLSAETLAEVDLLSGRPFPLDRVFALEDGPSGFDPERPAFIKKSRFAVLARFPALACVRARFEAEGAVLTLQRSDALRLQVDLRKEADRQAACRWLTDRLGAETLRGPLRLVFAEGHRFTDDPAGHVSLVNLRSVEDLGGHLDRALDPLRFRANVYVDDWPAWSELTLPPGARIALGSCVGEVIKPIVRCRAVDVDLARGEWDLDVPGALDAAYGHMFCGIYLKVAAGGRIRIGDRAEAAG